MYGKKRMSAQEHMQRVKFDYTLVDAHIPGNKFNRIYPVDPGRGGYSANGDDLEDFYIKLEKMSTLLWKKGAGLIAKKEPQPPKEKKKKGKSKRHLLTSMTYHIKKTGTDQDDIEEEEPPEDGEEPALGEIQEEEKSKDLSENESEPEEAEPSADEPDKDQEEEKQVPLEEGDEAAMHGASMTEIQNSMLRTA